MTEGGNFVELAGSRQACPCHVCAFFGSKEEEYRVLLPFMREGYEHGDKLVNIIDENEREERLGRFASAGLDVDKAERTGQLELKAWEEAHIVGGHFDQKRMLASLDAAASTGSSPYRLTRLWSNQEWALRDIPGVEDLIEYESCFNTIWPKHGDIVVCVYDHTKFNTAAMIGLVCVHPFILISGILLENPFYTPPEVFAAETRAR